MALKALKCPNCEANIQVDDDREFGFCSYCGSQVQIKEVMEVHMTDDIPVDMLIEGMFEKKIQDGKALLKLEDYYRADQLFAQLVRDNPSRPEAYEMRIRSLTRNYHVFPEGTRDFIMKQAEMMIEVAPEKSKEYYEGVRQKLIEDYERDLENQEELEKLEKLEKINKMIKESYTMILCSGIFAFWGISVNISPIVACAFFFLFLGIAWFVILFWLRDKIKKEMGEFPDEG